MDSVVTGVVDSVEKSGRKRKKLTAQEKWQFPLQTYHRLPYC